jgi:hypothetical protein
MANEHEVFKKDVGTWSSEVIVTPAPGMPPQPSRGEAVGKLIAGGKWLVVEYRNDSGFEGHGIYGWDAGAGRYVATWVDEMRPSIWVMHGDWDAKKRTMTFHGEATKPDGSTLRWREITESIDDDTRVMRSIFPGPDGTDFEMITVTYRRKR